MFELGLKVVSDLHVFREGIRPLWEDEANKAGFLINLSFERV